ncbi:MAG: uridine diphosphate-N-acetylglucosamine-binding protein YvcK [Actinomycetia bacterium]|nr:uridine diphosphate-N-acetylglucosamine-binding protein YvcK [Actinomycetes bacterium]
MPKKRSAAPRKVVAIGGGTGLPLILRSLLALDYEPTAIVTMADDGGSSGRLRRELGILPPGDVRNCLAALAAPAHALMADLLGYRFEEGEGITGHAVGNLMLAALTDRVGDFDAAVKYLERLLEVRGRVLPSTFDDVVLSGYDRAGTLITGQESLAKNPVAIADVDLELAHPEHAPGRRRTPRANAEAVAALEEADLILICPGSLYTSIIPNFLVSEIRRSVCASAAPVIYFCNVANMRGETSGYTPLDYVDALTAHGLRGCIDAIVLPVCGDATGTEIPIINATQEVIDALQRRGLQVFCESLTSTENPYRHDQQATIAALERVIARVVYS